MHTTNDDGLPGLSTDTDPTGDLSTTPFALQQKIDACKALYLAYQGRHHEAIEREMRELGHTTFSRRVLYTRNQHGRRLAGWPARFGWVDGLTAEAQRPGVRVSEPGAVATGSTIEQLNSRT